MRARIKTEVIGGVVRRRRSLVAVCFTLFLSSAGVLGFFGPADAATTNQLLPPKPQPTLCPRGTALLTTGTFKGFCRTVEGVIFNPITKKILYAPQPTLPVNPPTLPSTEPPTGTQPNPGTGTGTATSPPSTGGPTSPGGRPHLISSSITSAHSYGTPYGVYFGNFGGGKTFFSPSGRYETYRKVFYLSAFGRPLNSDVSTAVIDATRAAPVSTQVPQAPDEVWLLLPFGLVLLTMVTYLVLEPDADRLRA